ncbi:MAG: dTDP-4-dehydrorhamnose 3,5-epimerase [Bdellovibrionota bacterium]|nr:dTDP-4-dehydrorhamnose 3,5-epimerase [Bdellovibrionota bacterium]
MKVLETPLNGLLIIEPKVFSDDRGYFFESFNKEKLKSLGVSYKWVQDNQSFSEFGTVRGLHFQKGENAQTKLVRVVIGRVLDVVVDLRKESLTFGQMYSIELNDQNHLQLLVPKGFAHGFSVLSKNAVFSYKVDEYYDKSSEGGIRFDDPDLNIDWGISKSDIKLSLKDESLPYLKSIREDLF